MSTPDTVKAQLQSLIASANAKTGKTDTDLTAAVDSLVAGYGQGSSAPILTELSITENGEYLPSAGVDGFSRVIANIAASGGGGASGIYMAKVTPASDTGELKVTHNLGTTDILVAVCWAESLGDVTPAFDGAAANVYLKSSLPFRMSNSSNHENMIAYARWSVSSANVTTISQPTSGTYFSEVVDENTFAFASAGSAASKYFAGVTYTVIIMAASAFAEV